MKYLCIINCIFLFILHTPISAQIPISGIILGEDQNGDFTPLIGASVIEEGTSSGGLTDENGQFSISVNDFNKSLKISYLGYPTAEVPITYFSGQNTEYRLRLSKKIHGRLLVEDNNGNCDSYREPIEIVLDNSIVTHSNPFGIFEFNDVEFKNSHEISISLAGFAPFEMEVNKNNYRNIEICLRKIDRLREIKGRVGAEFGIEDCRPRFAELTLTSSQGDQIQGKTDGFGRFTFKNINISKHKNLTAKVSGYYPLTVKILLSNYDNLEICLFKCDNLTLNGFNSDEGRQICEAYDIAKVMIKKIHNDIDDIWNQPISQSPPKKRKIKEQRKEAWSNNQRFSTWLGNKKISNRQIRKVRERIYDIQDKLYKVKTFTNSDFINSLHPLDINCCNFVEGNWCVVPTRYDNVIFGCSFESDSLRTAGTFVHETSHFIFSSRLIFGNHFGTTLSPKGLIEFANKKPKKARKNPYSYHALCYSYYNETEFHPDSIKALKNE